MWSSCGGTVSYLGVAHGGTGDTLILHRRVLDIHRPPSVTQGVDALRHVAVRRDQSEIR